MRGIIRQALTYLLFSIILTLVLAVFGDWLSQVARDKGLFDDAGSRWDLAVSAILGAAASGWLQFPLAILAGLVAGLWGDAYLRRPENGNGPKALKYPGSAAVFEARPTFDASTEGSIDALNVSMPPIPGFARAETGGRINMSGTKVVVAPDADQLAQQLMFAAMLVEQYTRLVDACFVLDEWRGQPAKLRDSDLGQVAMFVATEVKKYLPHAPFSPKEPFIYKTEWNRYRYVFPVPMRIPPRITFPDLPKHIEARILHRSKIDFEVELFDEQSQNRTEVPPPKFEADAEL